MKNYILILFVLWCMSCAPEHENIFPYVLTVKRITSCAPEKPYNILALDQNLMYAGSNVYPRFTEICRGISEKLSAPQIALDSYCVPLILCQDGVIGKDSLTVEITIEQKTSGKRLAFFTKTLIRGDTLVLKGNFQ